MNNSLKTFKNYIGNQFLRSESLQSKKIEGSLFTSPNSSKKDLRNSITSNIASLNNPKSPLLVTQLLHRVVENLQERDLSKYDSGYNSKSVNELLISAASLAQLSEQMLTTSSCDGGYIISTKPTRRGVRVLAIEKLDWNIILKEIALSVIANNPLTILAPCSAAPALSTLAEVLQNSDFTPGMINILFGDVAALVLAAAQHEEVTALSLSTIKNKDEIILSSITTLKRVKLIEDTNLLRELSDMMEFRTIWSPISPE